jgi:alkyl hydroperoxide reductase subunit F
VLEHLGIEISFQSSKPGPQFAVAASSAGARDCDVDAQDCGRPRCCWPHDGLIEIQLGGASLKARSVIISTSTQRNINVPANMNTNFVVAYCPHCDGPLFKGNVAVIGGAIQASRQRLIWPISSVASRSSEFDAALPIAVLQHKLRNLKNDDRADCADHWDHRRQPEGQRAGVRNHARAGCIRSNEGCSSRLA